MKFSTRQKTAELLQDVVKEAIENEYLITLMIDEWTKVYTKRRPTDESTSVADNFCTIIIKVVKDIKAIPRTEVKTIHNPKGIDVESLSLFLFSQSSFENLSQSYVATLPELSALFFDQWRDNVWKPMVTMRLQQSEVCDHSVMCIF